MTSEARRAPGYGRGIHTIDPEISDPEVLETLRSAFRSPSFDPPVLPVTALRLLELTRKSTTTFRDALNLIESEPMVAARVLRVAQSAFYARGDAVRTLEQAIKRLGMVTLGQIFLQVSLTTRMFRAPGYEKPMLQLRRHAVAVANASRLVCRETAMSDELAFLCGLLHDIGGVVSMIVLGDVQRPHKPPAFELVTGAVQAVHEEAAGLICDHWNLPAEVRLVLTHHHNPLIGGVVHPLACVIVLADELASDAGLEAPFELLHDGDLARRTLEIDARSWRRLGADFSRQVRE